MVVTADELEINSRIWSKKVFNSLKERRRRSPSRERRRDRRRSPEEKRRRKSPTPRKSSEKDARQFAIVMLNCHLQMFPNLPYVPCFVFWPTFSLLTCLGNTKGENISEISLSKYYFMAYCKTNFHQRMIFLTLIKIFSDANMIGVYPK